jgi:hypothetical protein
MNENNNHENEISLIDIFELLQESWKTIAGFTVLGIAGAAFYLSVVPKQYEARVQIVMAQISATNSNISTPGINIEEPALLILRLSFPTSYTPETLVVCGLQDQANPGLALSSIKLTVPKGAANLVELKTFGGSQQVAHDCALAVFDLIKATQAQFVAPYIEEAKIKLADAQERLQKANELVARSDKSCTAMSVAYQSMYDEIKTLKDFITSNQNRATRMIAPIYASDTPIALKKSNILAVGLFGGLFFGLLIALSKRGVSRLKSEDGAL